MAKKSQKSKTKIGKVFEGKFADCCKKQGVCIIRLPDQTSRYKGAKNICDYVVYEYPVIILAECKTVSGVSLPFSNISNEQWTGLLEHAGAHGVAAGIICWFRKPDITAYYDIRVLENLKKEGKKSINYKTTGDLIIPLTGEKKRVYTDYDIISFLEKVRLYYE